ncbi:hypothetical protein AWB77_04592 [Caballeronia fortuita]|uniref:SnoaL-like domain-containing protein n=1 Tax=Caballeronia fortuita TaxID=1777138 RepID=A0A158CVQ7_9BURK|nr:nuclear transport factor 2 family protein [Caballeronia fortuita]SAK86321.1 hypothetical protein AWB77_04592 [Caballeronia fortuita]
MNSPAELLREMFEEMVLKKDLSRIAHYYSRDFILETNGNIQDYAAFESGHAKVYPTSIRYDVRYDEATWVESEDRVAVRLWIKTQRPDEAPVEFEILLIASFVDGKIHRVWETTYPDWRQVKAFDSYSSQRE